MESSVKVKKPIEAIQCANAFSLLQRKMYNVLLANAAANLRPDVTHRIAMRHLCQHMGYHSNDYKTIKQKFRELRRMDIEWDIINEQGNNVWTNTSPLSLARIIEGEGICEYEFTPSLVPFLDRPAQYAKFSLAVQAKFKSAYGLALYENCERYRNIGHTKAFDVPTFRKLMGVGEGEYVEFFALKRRVISKAINEVNRHADFTLDVEYKKEGRQVVNIRFIILTKADLVSELIAPKVDNQLMQLMQSQFAMNSASIQTLLKQYDEAQVSSKIDVILQSNSFKQGQIKNMAAYLKSALKEDYQDNLSSQQVVQQQVSVRQLSRDLKDQRDKLIDKAKQKHQYFLCTQLPVIIGQLSDKEKRSLLSDFESYVNATSYANLYEKNGLKDVLITEELLNFIFQKVPTIAGQFSSFDSFMQQEQLELQEEIASFDEQLKMVSLK